MNPNWSEMSYFDPGFRQIDYEFMRFGSEPAYWAGFMHNISNASYGNGNDFTIFSYSNRDIVMYPGTGQIHLLGGNVGIGTTNPVNKLDVSGTVKMIGFKMPTEAGAGKILTSDASGLGTWENAPQSSPWLPSGNGIYYNTGKVGIGTTYANEELEVSGQVIIGGNGQLGLITIKDQTDIPIAKIGDGFDYAESFSTIEDELQPGTVMIIDPNNSEKLSISNIAYDKKVAGIIAGANGLGSGVMLGSSDSPGNHAVALAGRVFCNVDSHYGAIEPGDLLTSSPNPGYAMVVKDYDKAKGAIIGKAMQPMAENQEGKILVLVTLQ